MTGQNKRRLLLVILMLLTIMLWLPTPYVIIEPGQAFAVHPMVHIEDSYATVSDSLLLTTVRMSYANGSRVLQALFDSQAHIFLKSKVLQGQTPEQYLDKQMVFMHTSQNDAIQAAYNKAGVAYDVTVDDNIQMIIPKDRDKTVHITAGDIGGPSAGLVFALEIYNRLVSTDITKGYRIAGTGEINPEGQVGAIGGIQYKVVAAEREGADIFFVPKLNMAMAEQQAKRLRTKMQIVSVETLDDVLQYLDQLPLKRSGA